MPLPEERNPGFHDAAHTTPPRSSAADTKALHITMNSESAPALACEVVEHTPTAASLHDNVQSLDRLLLQLAQQASRQPRSGGWCVPI